MTEQPPEWQSTAEAKEAAYELRRRLGHNQPSNFDADRIIAYALDHYAERVCEQRVSAALEGMVTFTAAMEVVRAAKAHEDAAVSAETERCAIVALEQRCERTFSRPTIVSYEAGDRTPWDLACTTIADKIRAPAKAEED